MAKVKKTKKINHIKRIATTKVNNKLSILLIVFALLVFALAAISMSSQSGSKTIKPSPVATISATSSAKPVVKPAK
jgi:hypothetical protein